MRPSIPKLFWEDIVSSRLPLYRTLYGVRSPWQHSIVPVEGILTINNFRSQGLSSAVVLALNYIELRTMYLKWSQQEHHSCTSSSLGRILHKPQFLLHITYCTITRVPPSLYTTMELQGVPKKSSS